MRAPSFHSDPHIQFLSALLEEIGDGGLQVPRFQRPMVWDWDRRLELLRSIRDGIPIGSIMVWRTGSVLIDCYDRLGPHKLKPPLEGAARQYILDGVQRLSTLYGALHRPQTSQSPIDPDLFTQEGEVPEGSFDDDEAGAFDVYFDPVTSDFVSPELRDSALGPLVPISLAFDSVALLRFQRGLAEAGNEAAIKAIDRMAKAFRDYKIPIIPITTDDVNLATRTFQRINSQGARMTEAHMVHALTWNSDFNLQERIRELKEKTLAERGWDGIDDDPILKACKAAFGLDVYKTNAQEFSSALLALPNTLSEVVDAIARVAEFLWDDCGVPSPDLMPYALQIVVLTEAFRVNPTPSSDVRELLQGWFWMTTYGELFAGMSGDRVQLAISDIHTTVLDSYPKWTWKRPFEERPIRRTFDFRAARAKAFAYRLAAFQDEAFGSRAGTRLLAEAGRKALTQIVPVSRATKAGYSSPGNRFLVSPNDTQEFRERLFLDQLSERELAAHGITPEARDLLCEGDVAGFIARRLEDVVAKEREFVVPLVSLFEGEIAQNSSSVLIDEVLKRDLVNVVHSNHRDRFIIKIGQLETPITITLTTRDDRVWFTTSHAIKTPLQLGPYWTSRPFEDTAAYALRRALGGMEDYYREAVRSGFSPQEDWLVPA